MVTTSDNTIQSLINALNDPSTEQEAWEKLEFWLIDPTLALTDKQRHQIEYALSQ